MQSLLGQFYNRIKGSQEDLASESLSYILNKSVRAKKTINQIIYLSTGLKFSELSYSTQNIGDKLERPEISGKDEDGKEVLIIEAKFWAALTSNQPNEYLNRLSSDSVLMFIVPSLRERTLFDEVIRKLNEAYTSNEIEIQNPSIRLLKSNQFLIIKSWNELLNSIKSELQQENNQTLISDIDQLIGFCDTIDSKSFVPMTDNDLSPMIAKKINSYYDIVDKVVDELKNRNKEISTKGLMKTPHRYGYGRYFRSENFAFRMNLKLDLWAEYGDTPFWLYLREIDKTKWILTEQFKRKCKNLAIGQNRKFVDFNNEIHISLKPILNQTEDIVINDLADQVEFIYKGLGR